MCKDMTKVEHHQRRVHYRMILTHRHLVHYRARAANRPQSNLIILFVRDDCNASNSDFS